MLTVDEVLAKMENSGMASEAHSRLYCHEIVELIVSHEEIYDLICSAFSLGYYRGVGAERYKQKKRKNRN